jgi:molybdenum transport protein
MRLPILDDDQLRALLNDDVPLGDLTTYLLGIGDKHGVITFSARQPMVVAGSEEAARLLELSGAAVSALTGSGTLLHAGAPILAASGPAAALHRGWKVAQTLTEYASGIATAARNIVDAAEAGRAGTAVVCTRKTMPGAKAISVKAILAGRALPHRLGLSETILIFAEHQAFLGDETAAETVARLHRAAPEKKVVVEVASIDEGLHWAAAGADVIQTEKFSADDVAALSAELRAGQSRALIAAAGGINAGNAGAYAAAGADIVVTSAPYSAKPLDVAVRIAAEG